MIFLTCLFLVISLSGIVRRNGFFASTGKKLTELELNKLERQFSDKEYLTEIMKHGCLQIILAFVVAIIEVFYFIYALEYDPLKYPTIIAMGLFVIPLLKIRKQKNVDEMNENEIAEYKGKLVKRNKFSLWSLVKSIIWTLYFGYMFHIFVFYI